MAEAPDTTTLDVGLAGTLTVAVPETTLQVPVPMVGVFAVRFVVVPQIF